MQRIDLILDFVTRLCREMLLSGANIERIYITSEGICKAYGLQDISITCLSSVFSVSAETPEGEECVRQVAISTSSIHLEKLTALVRLYNKIVKEKPDPTLLADMLREGVKVKSYPMVAVLGGYVLAMACLCRIFGGLWQDVLIATFNTVILFFVMKLFSKANLNRIITNVVSMFVCGSFAFLFVYIGFAQNFYIIIITNAFYLIPGINMVNGMRNIICGNEMNGIIELLKVILEVVTIVAGLYLAFLCFGRGFEGEFGDELFSGGSAPMTVELIILSCLASVGFGIVFQIKPVNLIFAGLGGALIRTVYISLKAAQLSLIVFTALSAFTAALYAEVLAGIKKTPSSLFLYPSIIPLIPGDLFYYAMVGLIVNNNSLFADNAVNCLIVLTGISVGFVLCSSITHYARKIKLKKINFKAKKTE